jgi:ribose transport system ATP-binding protein
VSDLVEFRGIVKRFPGVTALQDVTFGVAQGEVHALVGENGAGKSTLMNILGGQYRQDAGELRYRGEPVHLRGQLEALRLGIAVVYQELRLCPNLTVTESLFLGREREVGEGRVSWPRMRRRAAEILEDLGSTLSPDALVESLSIADQQLVEIARALSLDSQVIIMDEPTSALTVRETEGLFKNIRRLKGRGVTVIYISHRLEEVFTIADRISVLRDGRYLGSFPTAEITQREVVTLIAGRELVTALSEAPGAAPSDAGAKVALEVKDLSRPGCFSGISFSVREREILGIYGLQGSGRTEVLETIFGLAPSWSGTVTSFGRAVLNRSPRDAIRNGFAMIPENRRDAGIFPELDLTENVNAANPDDMSGRLGFLDRGFMNRLTDESIQRFGIKTDSRHKLVRDLSGGNQQKVVIAKWLATHPKVLLVDELTRGIDVGAKVEIYRVLKELREEGLAIVMVSSELVEVLSVSDRILVMKSGSAVGVLEGTRRTRADVIQRALGAQ